MNEPNWQEIKAGLGPTILKFRIDAETCRIWFDLVSA